MPRKRRERGNVVAPDPALSVETYARSEAVAGRRTSLQFLTMAAVCFVAAMILLALGFLLATQVLLVAAWFCGAFAMAWLGASASLHISWIARWQFFTRNMPPKFRPDSLVAATLWFVFFVVGGGVLVRAFQL